MPKYTHRSRYYLRAGSCWTMVFSPLALSNREIAETLGPLARHRAADGQSQRERMGRKATVSHLMPRGLGCQLKISTPFFIGGGALLEASTSASRLALACGITKVYRYRDYSSRYARFIVTLLFPLASCRIHDVPSTRLSPIV